MHPASTNHAAARRPRARRLMLRLPCSTVVAASGYAPIAHSEWIPSLSAAPRKPTSCAHRTATCSNVLRRGQDKSCQLPPGCLSHAFSKPCSNYGRTFVNEDSVQAELHGRPRLLAA
eukprot:s7042_g5.t1